MAVWALGINHTTAPLDLRGRFAYAIDQVEPTLKALRSALSRRPEAAILSTCNRTEIYCAGDHGDMDHTLDWLAHSGGVSPALLRSHAYTLRDGLAARHAFRVASGLDSMVLGEPQILGQLKDAVRVADQAGALGTTLNQLFQRSFAVAKEVRTSTEIGAHSISMAAAAVRLAGQLFEDLGKIQHPVRRRRRDGRTGRHPLCRAQSQGHRHCQPDAGTRRAAGHALRRRGDAPGRPAGTPARIRRRDQLHGQHPADHRPGRRGTGAEGAQAPADVHGRPGSAARHRARSQGPRGRLSLHRGRPGRAWCRPARPTARPPWPRPRRSSTPACRVSCTGWTSAAPCR